MRVSTDFFDNDWTLTIKNHSDAMDVCTCSFEATQSGGHYCGLTPDQKTKEICKRIQQDGTMQMWHNSRDVANGDQVKIQITKRRLLFVISQPAGSDNEWQEKSMFGFKIKPSEYKLAVMLKTMGDAVSLTNFKQTRLAKTVPRN